MAISFKKEVILEAIQEVLAEAEVVVIGKDNPKRDIEIAKGRLKQAGVNNPEAYKNLDTLKPGDTVTAEDHHENPNDESDMAKVQLHNTAKYCIELLKMIQDGQQLDAWVQSKLTVAFEHIDTVKHYLEGEEYLASTEAPSEEEPLMEDEDVYDTDIDDKKPSNKDLKKEKGFVAQSNALQSKAAQFNTALKLINKYKGNTAVVAGIIKKAKEEYKLPKNLLKDLARAAQVNENLTEGVSCCGRCGRVHESSQECKKPYISKDSPKHCSNKK